MGNTVTGKGRTVRYVERSVQHRVACVCLTTDTSGQVTLVNLITYKDRLAGVRFCSLRSTRQRDLQLLYPPTAPLQHHPWPRSPPSAPRCTHLPPFLAGNSLLSHRHGKQKCLNWLTIFIYFVTSTV